MYASAIISGRMGGERGEGQRQRHGLQARREKWTPGALLSTLTYLRKKPGVAMQSYRPVTLQQALTKIVTGVVAARLTEAIAQGAVLDPAQAGFVRGGLQRAGAAEMIGLAQRVLEQEEGPFAQRLVESILSLAGREDPQRAAALCVVATPLLC